MYLPGGPFKYLLHCFNSSAGRAESKFTDEFIYNILRNKTIHHEYQDIENHRHSLHRNHTLITEARYGAGTKNHRRADTVSTMARSASVSPKYGRLLFRLVSFYKPGQIIELGTALGISTMYLAMANNDTPVTTIEGNPQLAEIAMQGFNALGLKNITLINRTFDEVLPELTMSVTGITLVFIDGNHTPEATLRYYHMLGEHHGRKILVLDDINWSYPMSQAWKIISNQTCSGLVIDLFRLGIIFQGSENSRQNLRFLY